MKEREAEKKPISIRELARASVHSDVVAAAAVASTDNECGAQERQMTGRDDLSPQPKSRGGERRQRQAGGERNRRRRHKKNLRKKEARCTSEEERICVVLVSFSLSLFSLSSPYPFAQSEPRRLCQNNDENVFSPGAWFAVQGDKPEIPVPPFLFLRLLLLLLLQSSNTIARSQIQEQEPDMEAGAGRVVGVGTGA